VTTASGDGCALRGADVNTSSAPLSRIRITSGYCGSAALDVEGTIELGRSSRRMMEPGFWSAVLLPGESHPRALSHQSKVKPACDVSANGLRGGQPVDFQQIPGSNAGSKWRAGSRFSES
jgi:hypothetical protein